MTGMSTPASGQISITATGASYSENFDGMGSAGTSYLPGWTGIRYAGSGTIGAVLNPVVTAGSATSGGVYNVGSSGLPDRALGTLASGTTVPRIGAQFVNNTGVTITTINLAGVMEQWRSGSNNTVNEVNAFAYSFDATDLSTGSWTSVTGMDLVEKLTTTTTAAAVDGNAAANKTNISATINGLNWANGSTMWIRWSDVDNTGSDAILAIDDLSISFNIVLPPPGRGTASITPSLAQGAVSQALTVIVRGQSPYTLTNTNVVVPPIFAWSLSTGDISLTGGGSPSTSISGDTVKISGMTVAGTDSIQITINNITPADSTDTFTFFTQTGTQPDSILDLPVQPTVLVYGTPHAIGDIKANDVNGVPIWSGKYVTILGVVTVGAEFGSPSYIQDATGGIAVFGVITSSEVTIGDEVELVGAVSPFNGLTELNSPTLIKKVSSGNVVEPLVLNCGQVNGDGQGGVEQYEGRLVRINQVIVTSLSGASIPNWTVTGSGTNYRLRDAVDTLEIRVDNNVNFANTPAPQSSFDVIGVVSQFKNTSPFIGGYQLMPRSTADIVSQGPIFATSPVESNLQPTSMRISWTTINNGTTRVRYGLTTAYELGLVSPDNTLGLSHAVDLTGLMPATVYHVQAFTDGGANDTSFAGDLVVSTSSPPASTGQMNVYFNKSVDNSVSLGENALGNQNMIGLITNRIDNAHRSIDIALYSLSATAYGDVIATHLVSAKNRGVSIRVICEADNQNAGGSSFPTLSANGIPVINDKFDAVWFGAGLMHNKFFVFDGRGGAPESVWVWGGSWNPTNSGTSQDRQNSIEIQDQALAGAYTMEFDQMWGSSTETPNASTSRFGARKLDITPHNFMINGVPVSSYFSPSDHTTMHITNMIAKAQHSVSTCILTYTRKDIADTMIVRKNAGSKVRVVVDNNTDQGNQYSYLQSNGIDIHLKGGSGLLHHKYTTIDADQPTGPSYIETGSHNYSSSAENSNDENSLILQSKRIANLYLQEFAARYYEAGGTDSIHVSVAPGFSLSKLSIDFGTVIVSNSKPDSFVVRNNGTAPLTISSVTSTNPRFSVSPGNANVSASDSQKFYVTFSPTTGTPENGSIVLINDAAGSPDTVAVQGLGDTGLHPQFSVTPSNLNFGTHPIGSSSTDSFTVSNAGTSTLHLSSITSSNSLFTVSTANDTVVASGSKVFTVTFAPTVPGAPSGNIIMLHDAPGSPDTVTVQGTAIDTPITKSLSLLGGWNMISLPSYVSNGKRDSVFPTSISHAFVYNHSYMLAPNDSLIPGVGEWLKFDSAQSISVLGLRISVLDIPVSNSWNLIGSISSSVDVSSISSIPAGLVSGATFYGYSDTGYFSTTTLDPGRAYWVKPNGAGSLHLFSASTAAPLKRGNEPTIPHNFNTITVTDAKGRSRTLYIGESGNSPINLDKFEMPPTPPEGAFDVRFGSGRTVETHARRLEKPVQFPVLLQMQYYPIIIEWSIDTKDTKYYTLTVDAGAGFSSKRLIGKGQTTLNDPRSTKMLLTVAQEMPLPERFSLDQNYPNPFNPSTVIPFALPHTARVSIAVYNVLGEMVQALASDIEYEAGSYTVSFDASRLSTGVYYYRLTAVEVGNEHVQFHDAKKLLLIK